MRWEDVELPTADWLEELSKEWIHNREWDKEYAWMFVALELYLARSADTAVSAHRLEWVSRAQALFNEIEGLRTAAIVAALREGASLRDVAEEANVSHMTVQRIARRHEHNDLVSIANTNQLEAEYLNHRGLMPLSLEMKRALIVDRGWMNHTVYLMVLRAAPPGWLDNPENERRAIELTNREYANHDFGDESRRHGSWPPPEEEPMSRRAAFELAEERATIPNPGVGWKNARQMG